MRAEVKRFHSPDIDDLNNFHPEDPESFGFLLEVMIGPENQPGEESFDVLVCTPKWLLQERGVDAVIFGYDKLIVFEYNFKKIAAAITAFCERRMGSNWAEIAKKLQKLGHYEFEDYTESSDD